MIAKCEFKIFNPLIKLAISKNNYYFLNTVSKNYISTSSQDKKNGNISNNVVNSNNGFTDFEKTEVYQSLKMKIKEILEQENIVLFMKGTPEQPLCGYSANVVRILNSMQVKDYVYIDVMKNNNLRAAIKIYSNWPYIPHLYVKNNFIGGSDIISDLYNKGELENIIK
ncbi:1-cys-glutaredoxin-like protein-1 [Hepatocystis sp. ex Piliocolobus tephrosceles]|nr:1-cys-glutaredoxin-like protein-1 [Hepatocystis sp. ex Piliocolobus tephrosceles]